MVMTDKECVIAMCLILAIFIIGPIICFVIDDILDAFFNFLDEKFN